MPMNNINQTKTVFNLSPAIKTERQVPVNMPATAMAEISIIKEN